MSVKGKIAPVPAGGRKPWAQAIYDLRTRDLQLDQKVFAERLGVSQPAISAYEKGRLEPTAEIYILLGNLSPQRNDTRLWFWRKAGIETSLMASALEARPKAPMPEGDGTLVRVPLLRDVTGGIKDAESRTYSSGSQKHKRSSYASHEAVIARLKAAHLEPEEEIEMWVPLPAEHVPNPRSTVCLRAPSDEMRPIFGKGDILAVDVSFSVIQPVGFDPVIKRLVRESRTLELVATFLGGSKTVPFPDPISPIVAAYHTPDRDLKESLGLVVRKVYTSGVDGGNVHLSSELADRSPAFSQVALRKVLGELGGPDFVITDEPGWSILGRVICWIGSDPRSRKKERKSK